MNKHGALRAIQRLDHWPLKDVLHEKYKMPLGPANEMADFLTGMLHLNPNKRATAAEVCVCVVCVVCVCVCVYV